MPTNSESMPDRETSPMANLQIVSVPGAAIAVVLLALALGAAAAMRQVWVAVPLIAAATYCLFAIKVANEWEKCAVLRLGKFAGMRGPGMFHVVPILDTITKFVDQRVRVTDVRAETALTADTVPINVDAIVFWVVWDARKAILEVQDFFYAISLASQTALLESIGRHELSQMISQRESLGRELQRLLEERTAPWGITIQSVEIRDVHIPANLEDAMSRQAQAERERQARIILGTAETEISEKFAKASEVYQNNPVALHLRAMNMLYEAIKEKGSMVIVPSSAVETMGLGGMLGTAAMGRKDA